MKQLKREFLSKVRLGFLRFPNNDLNDVNRARCYVGRSWCVRRTMERVAVFREELNERKQGNDFTGKSLPLASFMLIGGPFYGLRCIRVAQARATIVSLSHASDNKKKPQAQDAESQAEGLPTQAVILLQPLAN
jgi:hypothetical protein